jgi:hypothetical protein
MKDMVAVQVKTLIPMRVLLVAVLAAVAALGEVVEGQAVLRVQV